MGGVLKRLPTLDPWAVKPVSKLITKAPSGSGAQHSETSHAHLPRGFTWPAWVAERIAPENDDSAGVKAGKIGLVILSPLIIGPLALAGAAVDHMDHFIEFVTGGLLDVGDVGSLLLWVPIVSLMDHILGPPILLHELPNYIPRTPDVSHRGEPEAMDTKTSGVAFNTVPPVPERPRERNKCGAAARGGRR